MKTEDAKKYALYNKYKHGDIIITTKKFLFGEHAKDITNDLQELLK